MLYPTPYSDVNAVLHELLLSVQTILGNQFAGMYLYGSLAAGDFDPGCSDIDFLIVTADEVSNEMNSALKAMHARIAASSHLIKSRDGSHAVEMLGVGAQPAICEIGSSGSKWATELEGSYIPLRALRRYDPSHARHLHIDRGREERLRMQQHDSDWVIQRHILREQGVVVTGPPPQTLIDPIQPKDLQQAVLEILRGWWSPMLHDPARLHSRGYQSFAVLTMCRMLYTLQYGMIVSKTLAAKWAQEALGECWAPLIERALVGRYNPRSQAQSDDVNGTLAFILHTLGRAQQFEMLSDA